MPRLSEIRYGVVPQGPQVKLEALEGKVVTLTGVSLFVDSFAPGAVLQIQSDESVAHVISYSQVVIATLEEYTDRIPFDVMFVQRISAAGRKFWTVE